MSLLNQQMSSQNRQEMISQTQESIQKLQRCLLEQNAHTEHAINELQKRIEELRREHKLKTGMENKQRWSLLVDMFIFSINSMLFQLEKREGKKREKNT